MTATQMTATQLPSERSASAAPTGANAANPAPTTSAPTSERTKSRLLEAVKTCGAATAQALADRLSLTVPAIRRHLQDLLDAGQLAVRTEKPGGRGRPQHVYALTEAGEATFPQFYAALCVDVLTQVQTLFGEGAVMQVMDAQRGAMQAKLAPLIGEGGDLAERLQRLAEVLREQGYAARLHQEGGQWFLTQHNCPAPAVARAFPELCHSELSLYSELLSVPVVREAKISCGASECRYKVG
ncbi:metalloregulator ArsR/SmtB family transcription factor [Deinococcus sp.]|uniref:helix-turn-helix transcriptional regulator n=1 Tax=Deinococcus sp. TaxID=47478 RepID=UPI0025E52FA6|nr:metalloregulator ArsR/SmtB family transcription factor [Deinococcus sp.]